MSASSSINIKVNAIHLGIDEMENLCRDLFLGSQPLVDNRNYCYLGEFFTTQGGYFVYNEHNYPLMEDVRTAIHIKLMKTGKICLT